MKTRHIVCFVMALATVGSAYAQLTTQAPGRVEFAEGEGILRSREGAQARFGFAVRQQGDRPAEGRLRFATSNDRAHITIVGQRLARLDVQGNVARFGGTAVLEVTNARGHTERFEGHVVVHVRDNEHIVVGDQRRVVDVMEIQFTTERSDRKFSFAGAAEPRSITVGERRG